jgi:hypothetical protein
MCKNVKLQREEEEKLRKEESDLAYAWRLQREDDELLRADEDYARRIQDDNDREAERERSDADLAKLLVCMIRYHRFSLRLFSFSNLC